MNSNLYIETFIHFYFTIPIFSLQPGSSIFPSGQETMFLAGKQEIMALDGTGVSYYIETVIVISVRISIILNRCMSGLHTLLSLYVSKFLPLCRNAGFFYFFI